MNTRILAGAAVGLALVLHTSALTRSRDLAEPLPHLRPRCSSARISVPPFAQWPIRTPACGTGQISGATVRRMVR